MLGAPGAVRALARPLVTNGSVSLVFGDMHPNPYIRALPDEPVEDQLKKLETASLDHVCAYPTAQHLKDVVDPANYGGRPYALALALGGAQLSHKAFDLHVLEFYRNDPRYSYDCDDIYGNLSARSEEGELRSGDQAFMRFGFAFEHDLTRHAAAFLWDLFKLTPEHQQMWKAREVEAETALHPDYYRTQILGAWPTRMSIYEAFLAELQTINKMAAAIEAPALPQRL